MWPAEDDRLNIATLHDYFYRRHRRQLAPVVRPLPIVIKPLAEAGADPDIQLHLTAAGKLDANLIDLSVKENTLQLNPRGRVEVEA